MYAKEGQNLLDSTRVSYELEREAGEDGTVPFYVKVLDEVTGTYTNRIDFREEDYANLTVQDIFRTSPGLAPESVQPGFSEWKTGNNERSGVVIPLPDEWHFVYKDEVMAGSRYCAVFQITDVHLNNYTSDAVPITSRNQTEIRIDPAESIMEEYSLTASLRKDVSTLENGLRLQIMLLNTMEESGQFWLNHLMINGNRQIEDEYIFYLEPAQSEIADILIPALDLTELETLTTLSFTISTRRPNRPPSQSVINEFVLSVRQEECRLDDFFQNDLVTGSGGTEDCSVSILKMEPTIDGKGLLLSALVYNQREEPLSLRGNILVNDRLQLECSNMNEIPAGCSRVVRCTIKNCVSELAGSTIYLHEQDDHLTNYILEEDLIQQMNQNPIHTLTFLPGFGSRGTKSGNPIRIELDEPFEVKTISNPLYTNIRLSGDTIHLRSLINCQIFQVDVAGIGWGTDGIFLVLRLENKMIDPITIGMDHFLLNNDVLKLDPLSADKYLIAPKSEMICNLILKRDENIKYPESDLAEIGLVFFIDDHAIRKCATVLFQVNSGENPYYTGDRIMIPETDECWSAELTESILP